MKVRYTFPFNVIFLKHLNEVVPISVGLLTLYQEVTLYGLFKINYTCSANKLDPISRINNKINTKSMSVFTIFSAIKFVLITSQMFSSGTPCHQ